MLCLPYIGLTLTNTVKCFVSYDLYSAAKYTAPTANFAASLIKNMYIPYKLNYLKLIKILFKN